MGTAHGVLLPLPNVEKLNTHPGNIWEYGQPVREPRNAGKKDFKPVGLQIGWRGNVGGHAKGDR